MYFFKDFWNFDVVFFEDFFRCKVSYKRYGSVRVCYIIDLDKYIMLKVGLYRFEVFMYYLSIYVLFIVLFGSR